jgi:hypothetical protein
MRKMAAETRGGYFEVHSVSDSFVDLIKQIENISANLIDQRTVTVTANKYFYFFSCCTIFARHRRIFYSEDFPVVENLG